MTIEGQACIADASHESNIEHDEQYPDWLLFTNSIKSGRLYRKEVNGFLDWQTKLIDNDSLEKKLQRYVNYLHDKCNLVSVYLYQ